MNVLKKSWYPKTIFHTLGRDAKKGAMRKNLSQDQLSTEIKENARISFDSRQLAERLAKLLPSRLIQVRATISQSGTGSSVREALTHPDYLSAIDELCKVRHIWSESRVAYETHVMLFKARQSHASWERTRLSRIIQK